MGLRFRKSLKVAPGVKLNLNKKSASVTFGGKGAHYTVNSKGKKTVSAGIPGTGISYVSTEGGRNSTYRSSDSSNASSGTPSPRKHKRGCVMYFLMFLLICTGILLFPLLWLASVPGIFISRRFMKANPKRKKKWTIILSILSLLSIVAFARTDTSLPDLETISIVNSSDFEMDINSDYELELAVSPDSAVLDELKLSDSADLVELEYESGSSTATIKSSSSTGATFIYLESNGIKSNKIKVTIVDRVAEQKAETARIAQKKAEEEAKKKAEEEAKLKAEEEAKKKAEAEAKKKAEEEAKTKAEASANSNNNVASGSSNSSVAKPSKPQGEMVWLSATGKKYHRIPNCGKMNPNTARQVTLSSAQSSGYKPCSKCF